MQIYTFDQVIEACKEYFGGDELAAKVCASKYLLRNDNGEFLELSPLDMFRNRIVPEFHRIEMKYENPLTFDTIFESFDRFRYIVPAGSPLYGIGHPFKKISLGNCFVIDSPVDSYGGICKADESIVQIAKRRGGIGVDVSNIRPKGLAVKNSAQSTDGIEVFMQRFSNSVHEVAQNGRRGALMISMSVKHPQILDFIRIKRDQSKVTGANISVRFSNEFFDALQNEKMFTLQYPVDAVGKDIKIKTEIDPKLIWDEFVKSNWASAEPGCFFWDTVISKSLSDCYAEEGFTTVSSNPCVVGDTIVKTSIGDVKMSELVNMLNNGQTIEALTFNIEKQENENTKIVFGKLTIKNSAIYKLLTTNGDVLKLTWDHKVYTLNRGYVKAGMLTDKDELFLLDKTSTKISSIVHAGFEDVYDIQTAKNHNFYANNILIHNCGEINLSPSNSCILMNLNLHSFVENSFTQNASFNFDLFKKQVRIATRLIDDLIDLEAEKIGQIIDKIESDPEPEHVKATELNLWKNILAKLLQGRRVGLGITSLGDMVARLNMKYASPEAFEFCEQVFKVMHETNFDENANLAKERGRFECWNWEKEKDNHHIKLLPISIQKKIQKYGRRNISQSTIPPAGSVSILTQTTSGMEPVYKVEYTRRKKVGADDEKNNANVSAPDSDGNRWLSFKVYHPGFKEWMKVTGKTDLDVKESPYYGSEAGDLNWKDRVHFQAMCNKYITHSISSTVNLSENVTVEEVSEIYLEAWKSGCKGITIFRDGSRTGILSTEKKKVEEIIIKETNAPKRPDCLPVHIFRTVIKSERWIFIVGLLSGKPYEIFGGKETHINIPNKYVKGIDTKTAWVCKRKVSKNVTSYDLILGSQDKGNDDYLCINDLGQVFPPDLGTPTRLVSSLLRHGMKIDLIIDQMHKIKQDDSMFTLEKGMCRVLKNYVGDGTVLKEFCTQCGGTLIYSNGCPTCKDCGFSKCS